MTEPEDGDFPKVINGITFNDQESYDSRVQQDANAMANLIYDIYIDRKSGDQ